MATHYDSQKCAHAVSIKRLLHQETICPKQIWPQMSFGGKERPSREKDAPDYVRTCVPRVLGSSARVLSVLVTVFGTSFIHASME